MDFFLELASIIQAGAADGGAEGGGNGRRDEADAGLRLAAQNGLIGQLVRLDVYRYAP